MPSAKDDDHGAWPAFLVFLRLGLTPFGGPVAHMGCCREEFVTRRRWLGERSCADLVALCQFLPGPLFAFAAFLGASMHSAPSGWIGGAIALVR